MEVAAASGARPVVQSHKSAANSHTRRDERSERTEKSDDSRRYDARRSDEKRKADRVSRSEEAQGSERAVARQTKQASRRLAAVADAAISIRQTETHLRTVDVRA